MLFLIRDCTSNIRTIKAVQRISGGFSIGVRRNQKNYCFWTLKSSSCQQIKHLFFLIMCSIISYDHRSKIFTCTISCDFLKPLAFHIGVVTVN